MKFEEELNEKKRKEQHDKICDIVALTSFNDKATKDTCFDIGIKEVINKPIHIQELIRIVLMYEFKLTFDQYKTYL
jgi:CheY-like chemotaxis protein